MEYADLQFLPIELKKLIWEAVGTEHIITGELFHNLMDFSHGKDRTERPKIRVMYRAAGSKRVVGVLSSSTSFIEF